MSAMKISVKVLCGFAADFRVGMTRVAVIMLLIGVLLVSFLRDFFFAGFALFRVFAFCVMILHLSCGLHSHGNDFP